MRLAGVWIFGFLAVLGPSSRLLAQEEGGESTVEVADPIRFHPFNLSAGPGISIVDPEEGNRETFIDLRMGLRFSAWKLAVSLDFHLQYDDDGKLLKERYDEPSDWLSFVEYVRFGTAEEDVYLNLGSLRFASLGHGTIISRYDGRTVYESPRTGFQGKVYFTTFGIEGLTNDLTSFELSGARFHVRPMDALGFDLPIVDRAAIGASWAGDIDAPDALKRDVFGRPNIDSRKNVRYREDSLSILGLDLEVPVLEGPFIHLMAYADQNFVSGRGRGYHLGSRVAVDLPFVITPTIGLRAEYIRGREGYIPRYFDTLYEVERIRYPEDGSPTTKRKALESREDLEGYYVEAFVDLEEVLRVEGTYEVFDQEDARVTFEAVFTGLDILRFRLAYAKAGIREADDVVSFDARTYLTAEAYLKLYSFLYLDLRFDRTWRLDERRAKFVPVDVYSPGLVIGFSW